MQSEEMRPPYTPEQMETMLAQLERTNPQLYAQFQAMKNQQMETAKEHLMSNSGQGHSHTHSSACRHGPNNSMRSSQPISPAVKKIPVNEMNIVQAVQYNELERVKELIETGTNNVNEPDAENCYLLHWAAINNHVELVQYLISKGATVDVKGGDLKSTPLHWACRQGCVETFFLLVDNGAAANSIDVNDIQPIHLAAQYGQLKILAFLIGSGIEVDCLDGRGFTPLIYSCLGPPANYQPIASATHTSCTQFLITCGADINYQEPTRHYPPIHFAIANQNALSFHVLLRNPHVDLNVKNADNCDAFTLARLRNNYLAVQMIEQHLQSKKEFVQPKFLQKYAMNEIYRKWFTRFYMFFVLTFLGLTANAFEHPYWLRAVSAIVVLLIVTHIFNYLFFDTHFRDNFAFAYVLTSSILMYVTYIVYIQENQWNFQHICYHLMTIYGLYCIRCIKKVDPGSLKEQTMMIDGYRLNREKICMTFARDPRWTLDHFCVTCLIRRPLRSKHCPMDGNCVSKFDHHCTWLDACIGGRNYFYFIRVITCGTVALSLWMYHAVRMISIDAEQFTVMYLFLHYYDPWFVYILFITSFNTFWVSLMTMFHLYNSIFLGVTLNERLTGFRYSYFRDEDTGKMTNPFRREKFKNFLETFGFFRLMTFFRYNRIDWSQIYDINQIYDLKKS